MPKKRPHILLLISDEHRPDVFAVEGNPHVRTPTLNRLLEQGTYFRNAYTPSPICVPARQSFLSGLYPRRAGSLNFGDAMPSEVVTIPGHLSRYGYRAVAAGKMHFIGPDQMHGWHERIGRDISGKNGYEAVEDAVYTIQSMVGPAMSRPKSDENKVEQEVTTTVFKQSVAQ